MAVTPVHQGQGIGSTLVRAGLDEARRQGWPAVIVPGHPHFYPRFGFISDRAARLEARFHGESFMALELEPDTLAGDGRVLYPAPFGD